MDTKSRNIRYTRWIKLLAVLVCVAGTFSMAWGLLSLNDFPAAMQGEKYEDSDSYANKMAYVYGHLYAVAFQYVSEENIRAGGALEKDGGYQSTAESLKRESDSNVAALQEQYQSKMDEYLPPNDDTTSHDTLAQDLAARIKVEQDSYNAKLEDARQRAIQDELSSWQAARESLDSQAGILYWAKRADGTVVTNMPAGTDGLSALSAMPGSVVVLENSTNQELSRGYAYYSLVPSGCSAALAMEPARFQQGTAEFVESQRAGMAGLRQMGAGLLAFLTGMAWLMYAAGRKPATEGVQLLAGDRVYLDIGFVLAGTVVFLGCLGMYGLYWQLFNYNYSVNTELIYVLGAALAAVIALTLVLYLTSVAKRIKRGEFFRHTLIHAVFALLARAARGVFSAGPLALRAALGFAGYAFLSGLFVLLASVAAYSGGSGGGAGALLCLVLFLMLNLAALICVIHKASALKAILDGVQRIKSGTLNHRIPSVGGGELGRLAGGVNTIAEGMGAALESELKAERMKAELITNVSHDLKTPLTSIITYIDLLKSEGPSSENAAQYIGVLDAKAQRLKALTEDLFEAAKAASGSIQPAMVRLDVGELITQGLGELGDRIRDSGLDFRCSLPQERLFVMADGRLLWRVLENLFSNVFKYAMPGSRVYVSAVRSRGLAVISVKNISAFELNIPAEELMERFTRGDASRHSEGSGLGLAIARSLTELMGGTFRIEVDGDLFKAFVELREDI